MKDELLIGGLAARDKAVFDYIFNFYYSSLCAYSMQYLNDRSAVEDIVQDFFVSLWIGSPNHQIQTSLKSYLFTGVKNRCFDFLKHQQVVQKHRTLVYLTSGENNNETEHYFAESELRGTILKCMEKLPPRCHEIFELSRFHGFSNQEIAVQLGLSKRTIELQISNALKILRKELVEYLPLFLIFLLLGA